MREKQRMPYVTTIQRLAQKAGKRAVAVVLETKFGAAGSGCLRQPCWCPWPSCRWR